MGSPYGQSQKGSRFFHRGALEVKANGAWTLARQIHSDVNVVPSPQAPGLKQIRTCRRLETTCWDAENGSCQASNLTLACNSARTERSCCRLAPKTVLAMGSAASAGHGVTLVRCSCDHFEMTPLPTLPTLLCRRAGCCAKNGQTLLKLAAPCPADATCWQVFHSEVGSAKVHFEENLSPVCAVKTSTFCLGDTGINSFDWAGISTRAPKEANDD